MNQPNITLLSSLRSGSRSGIVVISIISLTLSACSNHIKQLPNQIDIAVPDSWPKGKVKQDNISYENWLSSFNDPELNKYVALALDKNPDLLGSAARLKASIEQVDIAASSLWPSISAGVRRNKIKTRLDGITTKANSVSGALDVAWEIDLWGKLTQHKKATVYNTLAATELYRATRLALVAKLSRAWYNLITAKMQLDLAQQRLDSFERTATLIDENYKSGLRSALDVYSSRTDVQLQTINFADTEFEYARLTRAFKAILGEYPDNKSKLATQAKLPTVSDIVAAGLPAELVARRPDLLASQLQYKASIASAKAANRNRFPSISFNGSISDSREKLKLLFDNNNILLSLVGGVTQPIFMAGALKSQEQQAVHLAESAYANLLKTTLAAFEEVENALQREQTLKVQHASIKSAAKFAQGGFDLALDQYQSGIIDYTTVLESQRRLYNSLQNEINIRNALLQNRISLHLALGGDFSNTAIDPLIRK